MQHVRDLFIVTVHGDQPLRLPAAARANTHDAHPLWPCVQPAIAHREDHVLKRIHHAAIICADYARSRHFYTEVLGLPVMAEHYRAERGSYKLDLALPDGGQIELFSFPEAPPRPSYPEACGLRHLAFAVSDLGPVIQVLEQRGVQVEPVRIDEYTGRRFTFFADPDGLPLEIYEL